MEAAPPGSTGDSTCRSGWGRWIELSAVVLPALVESRLVLPLCSALFQCGCTWGSEGGADHCNVHQAAGPHCPWCSHGTFGWLLPAGSIMAATVLTLLVTRRYWSGRLMRWGMVALAGSGVWVLLVGAVTVWWTRYPRFLWWHWG